MNAHSVVLRTRGGVVSLDDHAVVLACAVFSFCVFSFSFCFSILFFAHEIASYMMCRLFNMSRLTSDRALNCI